MLQLRHDIHRAAAAATTTAAAAIQLIHYHGTRSLVRLG